MNKTNISKTKIKRHIRMKSNPSLIETIRLASKQKAWVPIAKALASSTRKQASVNLSDIDKKTSAGDTVVILGRVLAMGDISKKVRICSLGVSKGARAKLMNAKAEIVSIADEIKRNPRAEALKLIY